MNYWPALTPTVAKSLTKWWDPILVLSPLRESQLFYSVTASILTLTGNRVSTWGGYLGTLYSFSLFSDGSPLERGAALD